MAECRTAHLKRCSQSQFSNLNSKSLVTVSPWLLLVSYRYFCCYTVYFNFGPCLLEMQSLAALALLPQLMPGKLKTLVVSKHLIVVREVVHQFLILCSDLIIFFLGFREFGQCYIAPEYGLAFDLEIWIRFPRCCGWETCPNNVNIRGYYFADLRVLWFQCLLESENKTNVSFFSRHDLRKTGSFKFSGRSIEAV